MQIRLDRSSAQPLYRQLVQHIQQRIRTGALPTGARLPTVRELSRQLGVTRLTVHTAYSELQSGGWVEATVGRGTFVAARSEPTMTATIGLGHEFSPQGMINDMVRLAQLPGMRSLASANAAPELYPQRAFERALSEALADDGMGVLGYTTSQGDARLRMAISELLRERSIHVGPDDLVITSGVTQALALIAQTLARRGDTVIVERPTYLGALNVLAGHGLQAIGVPLDGEGMVVEALERLILLHRPRFIYTVPAFQNPSGICMSQARRAALLELAASYHVPVVEDDIYSLLSYEGAVPVALKAADSRDNVLHISSFSKSLLPGIRVGYIAAAAPLISRLVSAKQSHDLCSPPLLQRALAIFLERGWFAAHLQRVIPSYRQRRDALLDGMAQHFSSQLRWTVPSGGFSTWVELPPGTSATDLYMAAIDRGVAFAPGDFFFAEPSPPPFMRLSFSTQPPEALAEAAKIIAELLSSHLLRRAFKAAPISNYVPLV